jgi:hypothetical protein
MAALKPVGVNTTFATSTSSTQTGAISQQSDSLRIVAETAGVHVAFGPNPTATVDNYYVSPTDDQIISLGPVQSQRVVGYTKGTTTILDFPEGTGAPFAVGDAVTLTSTGQSGFDFSHQIVSAVDNSAGVAGYFNTRITVNYNSSGVSGTFSPHPFTELRKSIKVAVKTESGTGKVFIQQIQVS